jgi:hypothetical protein
MWQRLTIAKGLFVLVEAGKTTFSCVPMTKNLATLLLRSVDGHF